MKTILRFHLIPVRIAIFKGKNNNKCQQAIWRFLKKLKVELSYDPVIPLQGIYPKENKSGYNRDLKLMFNIALFTI
jgi:hypothetical protein